MENNRETLEKKSEELKKQIKKDLDVLNDKIENNCETLQKQLKEEGEKSKDEWRQQLSLIHI